AGVAIPVAGDRPPTRRTAHIRALPSADAVVRGRPRGIATSDPGRTAAPRYQGRRGQGLAVLLDAEGRQARRNAKRVAPQRRAGTAAAPRHRTLPAGSPRA